MNPAIIDVLCMLGVVATVAIIITICEEIGRKKRTEHGKRLATASPLAPGQSEQHSDQLAGSSWMSGMQALDRGIEEMQKGYYEEAVKSFDEACDNGVKNYDLFSCRGTCLQSMDWHLDAIDDFTRAIEFNRADSNTYLQRANSRVAVGDGEGALKDFDEAIRRAAIPSSLNRIYDANARESGWDSVAALYRGLRASYDNLDSPSYQRRAAIKRVKALERGRRFGAPP